MNREEAKKSYKEKVSGYLQESMELLEKNFLREERDLKKKVSQALLQLFSCSGDKDQIRYLQMSLLRSQMDDDVYTMLLSLHNETYFLDPNPQMQVLDISSMFAPLKEVRTKLYKAMGDYQGKIENFDADRMIRETAITFYKKQADHCRVLFRDLDHWRAENGLLPWNRLVVKWGGFQEESETVYLTDTSEKSQSQFLAYNEKNFINQWDSRYVYQSWERVYFTDMTVQKKNLLFLMLRECRMERCQWENCLIHGAEFQNSKLKQVVFAGCDMSGCNFKDVRFEQVQFVQCNLIGADFTRAEFEEIQFSGSQMENARFSRSGLYCNGLDASQLQQIRLEEEPYVF